MILIADSGATKTDWCLVDEHSGNTKKFKTQGINPQVQSSISISKMILAEVPQTVQKIPLDKIFYYGAGCSSLKLLNVLEQTLQYIFKCDEVEVNHDILGAVRSLCGEDPGIACILGTGSNSIYFDGTSVIKKSHALGYILGDEGSGAFLGKQLIADFLYQSLPNKMNNYLTDELELKKEDILTRIYKEENPNRYLASFSIILSKFRGENYVEDLLLFGFENFFRRHVSIYKEATSVPIHFTGSISHYFADVLQSICEKRQLTCGKIIKAPISGLVNYHLNQQNA